MSQASRPTYSEDQVRQYLEYIGKQNSISKEACDTEDGLHYLNELVPLQLARIPFENLDMHYSHHHTISLDTEYLFHKIVSRRAGLGGYCMQNNIFFGTMLRSMGYKVMPAGARVSSCADGVTEPSDSQYSGWSHMVNIVFIAGRKYFIDVGFGANCSSIAVPLEHGWTGSAPWNKEGPDMLLEHKHILDNTFHNEEQKLWVYQVRFAQNKPWRPLFCFGEIEFLPQDFFAASFFVSQSLHSWFSHQVVANKIILDEDCNNIGILTLYGSVVKERRYGKSQVLAELKSEVERVKALEKYFGIKLGSMDINGIKGYVTMLAG